MTDTEEILRAFMRGRVEYDISGTRSDKDIFTALVVGYDVLVPIAVPLTKNAIEDVPGTKRMFYFMRQKIPKGHCPLCEGENSNGAFYVCQNEHGTFATIVSNSEDTSRAIASELERLTGYKFIERPEGEDI